MGDSTNIGFNPEIQEPVSQSNKGNLSKIARNSAAMLSAQFAIKGLSFLFNVFVVRKLGASDFGVYSSIMAYAFIFAVLTDFGMGSLATRELARDDNKFSWMIPNIMIIRLLLSILLIIGNTISAWALGRTPEMVLGTFIASLGVLLYAFQGPLETYLIASERLYISSSFNVINQLSFVLFGSIALFSGWGYIGLLIASLIGVFLMGMASFVMIKMILKKKFDRPDPKRWKQLFKDSFSFGMIGVIVEVASRFDTVYMSFILTFTAVGYYSVSSNLIVTMMLLAQSVGLALFPSLVKEYNDDPESIRDVVQRSSRYMFFISFPIAIGGSLIAKRFIPTLYGEDFKNAVPIFQIMIWSLPLKFLTEILGRVGYVLRLEKKVVKYVAINSFFCMGLSILLIPIIGVYGSAIIMIINRLNSVIYSTYIIGPDLLYKGSGRQWFRIFISGIIMGISITILSKILLVLNLDNVPYLLILIITGGTIYFFLAFIIKAITPGEAAFLFQGVRNKVNFLPKKKPL
jgi:O-antigen/teichoic acid export membrane protein